MGLDGISKIDIARAVMADLVNGWSDETYLGPGADYPVIKTFAPNERGMQQITCVPFYTAAHFTTMTEAQIRALPPCWCLMRNQSMSKAGRVAQRHITRDNAETVDLPPALGETSQRISHLQRTGVGRTGAGAGARNL